MNSRVCLLVLLAMLLSLQQAPAAENSDCRALKLSEQTIGAGKSYNLNDSMSFLVGYDSELDTQHDYGARLMLLKKSAGTYSRIYYSQGSADSYGIRPTFIASCGGNELIILGEIGAEYSWGLRVFAYNDGMVVDLGDIPLAVEGETDALSVVPFMNLSQTNRSAILSFTKDLLWRPGSPAEKRIPRSQARYRLERNKLEQIQEFGARHTD